MLNFRLIAYISAAALAAVVLAYGLGRWQGAGRNAHVRLKSTPPS